MKSVGDCLPCGLKETAGGGMATVPTALAWAKEYFAQEKQKIIAKTTFLVYNQGGC